MLILNVTNTFNRNTFQKQKLLTNNISIMNDDKL